MKQVINTSIRQSHIPGAGNSQSIQLEIFYKCTKIWDTVKMKFQTDFFNQCSFVWKMLLCSRNLLSD